MDGAGGALTRAELISLLIRVGVAATVSVVSMRYMLKYLDPNHAAKEQAEKQAKRLIEELGLDRSVNLSEYELQIAAQLVSAAKDGVEWNELGGCDELIKELQERVILPLQLRHTHSARSQLLAPPKGVLLYGPPGCGKTLMAKAISRAAGARFINLQVSSLTDKWYGESQKLTAAVFSLARKFQPTIIFIDEIDSFLRGRQSHDHEATAMMKAQFMSLWDGFSNSDADVIVMGATNRPEDVDKAILRRMPARFAVPVPSNNSRAAIFRVILKEEPLAADIDFEMISRESSGLSGSDVKEICRLAVLRRARELVEEGVDIDYGQRAEERLLTEEDLLESVKKYRKCADVGHFDRRFLNGMFSADTEPLD
uniref:AAA+ ATPase domain-containing protein n=1 Tax=Plectus sambesii TaxID=2011161 RepID=A0A914VL29_9BILA